jgi:hypothetical protein
MQRALRRGFLLALISISALGVACGRTVGLPDSPQAGASSSTTPGAVGQITSGQVTLTLDKRQYTPSDTIVVTIHNGLPQAIWAADHQTNCTLVTAERLQDGQWAAMGKCPLMTPTRMVILPAGSSTPQQLSGAQGAVPPESQAPAPTESWTPGAYRVTLTYAGSADGTGGPGGVAHSVGFTIG